MAFYNGMDVLPPLVVPRADRLDEEGYDATGKVLRGRLEKLPTDEPLPFRPENDGDYDINLCDDVFKPNYFLARRLAGVALTPAGTPDSVATHVDHDVRGIGRSAADLAEVEGRSSIRQPRVHSVIPRPAQDHPRRASTLVS